MYISYRLLFFSSFKNYRFNISDYLEFSLKMNAFKYVILNQEKVLHLFSYLV